MANSLDMAGGPPDAPMPGGDQQQPSNALQSAPQSGQAAPQVAAQRPAPSHEQTVAALRHFGSIQAEVKTLLDNPQLGKSTIKSEIIDGVTKLVSDRIISPAQAVIQLSSVPDDPLQQRKWLEQQMATVSTAQNHILEDHRTSTPGTGDVAGEMAAAGYDPDKHVQIMDGVMSHYKGRKRG